MNNYAGATGTGTCPRVHDRGSRGDPSRGASDHEHRSVPTESSQGAAREEDEEDTGGRGGRRRRGRRGGGRRRRAIRPLHPFQRESPSAKLPEPEQLLPHGVQLPRRVQPIWILRRIPPRSRNSDRQQLLHREGRRCELGRHCLRWIPQRVRFQFQTIFFEKEAFISKKRNTRERKREREDLRNRI